MFPRSVCLSRILELGIPAFFVMPQGIWCLVEIDLQHIRTIMSGGEDGVARLWDQDRSEFSVLATTGGPAVHCAYQVADDLVVFGCEDGKIRIYEISSGYNIGELCGHAGPVWGVLCLFSDMHSIRLVSVSLDCTVRLWNFQIDTTRRQSKVYKTDVLRGHTKAVNQVTAARVDNHFFVITVSSDGTIRLWNIQTLNCDIVLEKFRQPHWCVDVLAPQGVFSALSDVAVVTGSGESDVRIWNIADRQCVRVFSGHKDKVWCVRAICDRGTPHVFSGSRDRTVRMWDAISGDCICVFDGHQSTVGCLLVLQDVLVTAGRDSIVRFWSISKQISISNESHRLMNAQNCSKRKRYIVEKPFRSKQPKFLTQHTQNGFTDFSPPERLQPPDWIASPASSPPLTFHRHLPPPHSPPLISNHSLTNQFSQAEASPPSQLNCPTFDQAISQTVSSELINTANQINSVPTQNEPTNYTARARTTSIDCDISSTSTTPTTRTSTMTTSTKSELLTFAVNRKYNNSNSVRQWIQNKYKDTLDDTVTESDDFTKGIGSKLLTQMGWQPGKGLGKRGQGRIMPVFPEGNNKTYGLGYNAWKPEETPQQLEQLESESQTMPNQPVVIDLDEASADPKDNNNNNLWEVESV